MKIRIKFRKYGVMKFIGHLDIMRYFQKAIRRAEIDIAYTEGFSPHQIMSFAAPLGVGIISDGEYLDIEVKSTRTSQESIDALNSVMVDGIEITDYVELTEGAKKAMSIVAAAEYNVWFKEGKDPVFTPDEIAAGIKSYFEDREEILITKQTKKSERQIDVRPHIFSFDPYEGTGESGSPVYGFHFLLSAGSEENIKPELIVEDFCRFFGKKFQTFDYQIQRKDVYAKNGAGIFVPLTNFGRKIVK